MYASGLTYVLAYACEREKIRLVKKRYKNQVINNE